MGRVADDKGVHICLLELFRRHRDANQIPPTGDADIFDCPSHGVFKVAGTLTALPKFKWASIPDWERALGAARARTKPGDWPLIKPDDLTVSL
jgi:hypothetical protein